MTARLLQPADANALITFWNTKARGTMENMGYHTEDLTLAILQAERNSGRVNWVGAFDASLNLRGVIQGIISQHPQAAYVACFGLDPNISLASIRNHRDDIARFLWNLTPLSWTIDIFGVKPGAQIAVEYCDAHFSHKETDALTGDFNYRETVVNLRAGA